MGKREYQIAEDGDFSIPLTTLRENMLVKVLDANGTEISRTGIETKKVVEKGSWNDTFPLEGGGEILLKLQFVLSEEDQSRIRMMRLSALKKKDGELINKSPILEEKSPTPSLGYDEGLEQKKAGFSDKGVPSQEEAAMPSSPGLASHVKSRTDELVPPNQDTIMECKDGGEDPPRLSPLSSDATTHLSETGSRKLVKILNPEQTSPLAPHTLKGGILDVQGPLEKTPRRIRSMISVFESGLAQESRASSKTFDGKDKTDMNSEEDDSIGGKLAEDFGSCAEGAVSDPRFRQTAVPDDPVSSPLSAELAITPDNDCSNIRKEKNRVRIAYLDNFCHDEEMPGIWIFPDNTRSICITTGGKHAVRLMECCVETITASMTEHPEEGTMPRNIKHEAKGHERRAVPEADLSSPAGGPTGQAMRIAVMVGFGLVVLFTRRRQDR